MSFFYEILVFYTVPFFTLALLTRWWLFVPGSILAAALAYWMHFSLDEVDGPEAVVAPIIVGLIELGLLAGFLARGSILVSRWMGWRLPHPSIGLAICFFAVPPLCYVCVKLAGFVRI